MADEKKTDTTPHRSDHRKPRRPYILWGLLVLVVIAAVAWYVQRDEGAEETPSLAPPRRISEDSSPVTEEKRVSPTPIFSEPDADHSPSEKIASSREAFAPDGEEIAEASSAEKELHWQKTQMFMAEAKESLPLIGIRSFDARRATVRSSDEANGVLAEGETSGIPGRDDRGLSDGEVWIRIDPGRSREYKEIMAQTADLYLANTGFEGEVTVLLWVGGRVHARETFDPAW